MWRKTPQTQLIKSLLENKGHATNQELARAARKIFPDITNTTVHRITTRLVSAGMASSAPSLNHVKVVDSNLNAHDHFLCQTCQKLVDINLSEESFNLIQKQLPGNLSRNNILIAGVCEKCEC